MIEHYISILYNNELVDISEWIEKVTTTTRYSELPRSDSCRGLAEPARDACWLALVPAMIY